MTSAHWSDRQPMTQYPLPKTSDITLRRVGEADLPVLREHRNLVSTRLWLENTELISLEQQAIWYRDGGAEGFRIIEVEGQAMGLGRLGSLLSSITTLGRSGSR